MSGTESLKLLTALLVILNVGTTIYSGSASPDDHNLNFTRMLKELSLEELRNHIESLSRYKSRVTGYPGCGGAADYIELYLRNKLKLNVLRKQFGVVVPLDKGSKVTLLRPELKDFQAYALWPNYVQPSRTPEGIVGRLIYVRDADLEDLEGYTVRGAIALLEFDTGKNWVNLAKLGAKAVIFIEPRHASWPESISKFSNVPFYFPRLYVNKSVGEVLRNYAKGGDAWVRINVNMDFEEVNSSIIVAEIPGEVKDEIIGIIAHYDTWSVVPAIAPGSDEASSTAALLSLAKFFSRNKPRRTIWIIAVPGHWEGLAGPREFVEQFIFGDEGLLSGERKLLMLIGLDLSSDSDSIAVMYRGYFYDYGGVQVLGKYQKFVVPNIHKYLDMASEDAGINLGKYVKNGLVVEGWWDSIPAPFMLDTEPATMAHMLGFTLRTSDSLRYYWGSPLSDTRYVNYDNLRIQFVAASAIIYGFANDPDIDINWELIKPSRVFYSPTGELAGFITIHGRVIEFNFSKNWYDPVPHALAIVTRYPHTNYPFIDMFTICDRRGRFEIHGAGIGPAIGGTIIWGTGGAPIQQREGIGYYVEAYVLDRESGLIAKAPDMGQYGARAIMFWSLVDSHPYNVTTVVFTSSSAVIFDLVDVSRLSETVLLDNRFLNLPWVTEIPVLTVYNRETISEFLSYGQVFIPSEGIAVVFAPPGKRFTALLQVGAEHEIHAMLLNSSYENPDGYGYLLISGAELRLNIFNISRDVAVTVASRYEKLKKNLIKNPGLEDNVAAMLESYDRFNGYIKSKKYKEAYGAAVATLGRGVLSYGETMRLINEPAIISVFFFSLVIPTAFFLERLVIRFEGLKRLFTLILITFLFLIIFYIYHPSLKIVKNVPISYLGLATLLFFSVIGIILSRYALEIGAMLRRKMMKRHVVEKERISVAILSVQVAVENLRRRKVMSLLMFITITLIVLSLTSLTSLESFTIVKLTNTGRLAAYSGLYIKQGMKTPEDFLSPTMVEILRSRVGDEGVVLPIAWYYPQTEFLEKVVSYIRYGDRAYPVYAAVGLTPEEGKYNSAINESLVAGRWFDGYQRYACVLSKEIADRLNVSLGDIVSWQGINLVVVGIIAPEGISEYAELDQRGILPLNPNLITITLKSSVPGGTESYAPLHPSQVIILPYDLVIELGGYVSAVSVRTSSRMLLEKLASEIPTITDLEVYVGYSGNVWTAAKLSAYAFKGLSFLLIPLIIGGGVILNTMLSVIKMREREMMIYSSLGLPPSGVILLFMGELTVFAFVSTAVGYLMGLILNNILIRSALMPEEFVINYSSLTVLFAMVFSILATIIPSLYPAFKASRLVTPSLERRWEIPTKPRGDMWEIPLPFAFTRRDEVMGVLLFLYEFFELHRRETTEKYIVRENAIDFSKLELSIVASIAPFEAKVITGALLKVVSRGGRFFFNVILDRKSGVYDTWVLSSRFLVDSIRKQLLLWRSLDPKTRRNYVAEALQQEKHNV